MINITQLIKYFPENLQVFKRSILREYLQCKILEIIYSSKYALKLSFLGGTALRLIYDNQRFSEDLDFDNLGLTLENFEELIKILITELANQNLKVEVKIVTKGAFRCYLKFNQVLFDNKISPLKDEKLVIQIDTAPQNFLFESDTILLNRFDVLTNIIVTPINIIYSQKILTILERNPSKGRDFFDVLFLLNLSSPDINFLKDKLNIKNLDEVKNLLKLKCDTVNLTNLLEDLKPFVFDPKQADKILLFRHIIDKII